VIGNSEQKGTFLLGELNYDEYLDDQQYETLGLVLLVDVPLFDGRQQTPIVHLDVSLTARQREAHPQSDPSRVGIGLLIRSFSY
jgi:hypothetical protein